VSVVEEIGFPSRAKFFAGVIASGQSPDKPSDFPSAKNAFLFQPPLLGAVLFFGLTKRKGCMSSKLTQPLATETQPNTSALG
jgi:hypothetical protein